MSATATRRKPKASSQESGTITLPSRCKPSKCASTDLTRPILCHGFLTKRDDGMWLVTTNSYLAFAVKVRDQGAEEGYVPIGALKHMERGQHGEQLSYTAWRVQTEPYAITTFDIGDVVSGAKSFPVDSIAPHLWGDLSESVFDGRVVLGLNPGLLKMIDAGFGHGRYGSSCRLDMTGELRPIRVTSLRADLEAVASLMPVRLSA